MLDNKELIMKNWYIYLLCILMSSNFFACQDDDLEDQSILMHQRKKRVSLTAGYSKTTSIPITSTLNTEWNILNPIIRTILYLRTFG